VACNCTMLMLPAVWTIRADPVTATVA
jgi:hypothetical protein